jgi:hypothetical protein
MKAAEQLAASPLLVASFDLTPLAGAKPKGFSAKCPFGSAVLRIADWRNEQYEDKIRNRNGSRSNHDLRSCSADGIGRYFLG